LSTQTADNDFLDVITQLPPGSTLSVYDVGWDEYDRILAQIGDSPRVRISYDNGRMQGMSPSAKHERYKNLLHDFVFILSEELDMEVLSFGSTTLRIKTTGKGAEAYDCFYIQHATQIADKEDIDLTRDPAPDLVVEVDLTHDSISKLRIYAGLGVPEIWRFDGAACHFLHTSGGSYIESEFSLAFPFLDPERVVEFALSSVKSGPGQAARLLRSWLKSIASRS